MSQAAQLLVASLRFYRRLCFGSDERHGNLVAAGVCRDKKPVQPLSYADPHMHRQAQCKLTNYGDQMRFSCRVLILALLTNYATLCAQQVVPRPQPPPHQLDWHWAAERFLIKLRRHASSYPFNQPVDAKLWKCHDYYEIIKAPMDLGTMLDNLRRNKYCSVEELRMHLDLVFSNAFLYNPAGSEVHKLAQEAQVRAQGLFNCAQGFCTTPGGSCCHCKLAETLYCLKLRSIMCLPSALQAFANELWANIFADDASTSGREERADGLLLLAELLLSDLDEFDSNNQERGATRLWLAPCSPAMSPAVQQSRKPSAVISCDQLPQLVYCRLQICRPASLFVTLACC